MLTNQISSIGLTVLATVACAGLHAQDLSANPDKFPSKPIRWIVAGPPGGSPDVVARIIGQHLGERLKQPVIIDNRAGAFGNIGMEAAARAVPDGHTILLGIPTVVINPVLYKLTFDPLSELTAVTQLTTVTFVLLANPNFTPSTVNDLLAAAKAKPGTVTCGWGGPLPQLACELLKIEGHVDINSIPYKGNAPAMKDLIGGEINLLFDVPNVVLAQVKANRVRAIATTNSKRGTGPFGHLPTINESLSGFEFEGWQGVLAPARTPREIVARLNYEVAAVLESSEVRKRLADGGLDVAHGSPEAFAEIIRRDHAKYSKIISDAGIKAE